VKILHEKGYEKDAKGSLFFARVAVSIDNICQEKIANIDENIEDLLDWLCEMSRTMSGIVNTGYLEMLLPTDILIIAKALGYNLDHPVKGDTIGEVFGKLQKRLTNLLETVSF